MTDEWRDYPLEFGVHKGKPWRTIPIGYLNWLAEARPKMPAIIRRRHYSMAAMELKKRASNQMSVSPPPQA